MRSMRTMTTIWRTCMGTEPQRRQKDTYMGTVTVMKSMVMSMDTVMGDTAMSMDTVMRNTVTAMRPGIIMATATGGCRRFWKSCGGRR